MPGEKLTMNVDEAAALLGISRAHAYEMVRRGEIPSLRLGRRIVIPDRLLRELLGAVLPGPVTGDVDPST